MKLDFTGKTAVVTGGSEGIGLAIARAFLDSGAGVAICSRSQIKLDRALAGLNSPKCLGMTLDVADRPTLFEFADRVEEHFGGIDIWVSNAGILVGARLIETSEEEMQRLWDVNVKSIYYGGLIAADKIRKRGGGSLINGSSYAALLPVLGGGAYAASKAAVLSMTRSLAAELAPFNIRVNAYCPGVVETAMTSDVLQAKRDYLSSQNVLGRVGRPEEIAGAVLFLASEQASYITGTHIEISGGKFCVQNPGQAW
ncbi:MAG: SDR family oxidoreductase [Pseudomonadota bacterium]